MSYGYLGEIENINLDTIKYFDGYYAVNDPNVVSTFNNYPDDSHILQKVLYNIDELNAKYKIYKDVSDFISSKKASEIRVRHEDVFKHLSGTGSKCIKGVLEVRSVNQEDSSPIICVQKFYRANDNIAFIRVLENDVWGEWKYMLDDSDVHLQMADDLIISKDKDTLKKGFKYYAPPYDDTRIRNEITKRVTVPEFDTKLRKNDTTMSGTFRIDGGGTLFTNGPFIINTKHGDGGDGSYVHGLVDGTHYQQVFRSYGGPSLGVGHNNGSQLHFNTPGRGGQGIYPTNIFWNDPNNLDYEIQTLSRLRFKDLEGTWPHRPEWGDRGIPVQGLDWDKGEDIMIQHAPINTGNIYGYGMGTFILPTHPKENMDIYLTGRDAAWDGSDQPLLNCRIRIWWSGDTMMVGANGIVFRAYAR